MTVAINRRAMLAGGAAASASLLLPARAARAATVTSLTPYERRVADVAIRQQSRMVGQIWQKDNVGIADFALPSWKPRMHLVDMQAGTVRSFLLAHGKGSDFEHDGWLKRFSDEPGSEATSRGAFRTDDWYTGKYGVSLRLAGLDPDNSTALERLIVIHPAWYAEADMIEKWGKLGRSSGCFALGRQDYADTLMSLYGGRLLFADRIGEG
ncbi:MAG: murein L,D-transpeptidase catalytic domain family protein [Novosphingobium sp.]|nr:murein L,D-transpeptidase catalytic domain family protein [Novosphingobium sp.]